MWHKTKDDQGNLVVPDTYREVVYKHSCNSKGIGKLSIEGSEIVARNALGKTVPNYGYPIIAWCELPKD